MGGPVDIPKVYNGKQKTFFFFAYSGFRLRGGLPPAGLDTLPTAQERQGNFSDYPYPIYDPATTAPDGSGGFTRSQINCDGALNVICGNRLSGVAQRTIALLPPVDIPTPTSTIISTGRTNQVPTTTTASRSTIRSTISSGFREVCGSSEAIPRSMVVLPAP